MSNRSICLVICTLWVCHAPAEVVNLSYDFVSDASYNTNSLNNGFLDDDYLIAGGTLEFSFDLEDLIAHPKQEGVSYGIPWCFRQYELPLSSEFEGYVSGFPGGNDLTGPTGHPSIDYRLILSQSNQVINSAGEIWSRFTIQIQSSEPSYPELAALATRHDVVVRHNFENVNLVGNCDQLINPGLLPPIGESGNAEFFHTIRNDSAGTVTANLYKGALVSASQVSCHGFEPPMHRFPVKVNKNRVLPLKVSLMDSEGAILGDADLQAPPVLTVMFTSSTSAEGIDITETLQNAGAGSSGNQFEFNDEGVWHFNLKTKEYSAPGEYLVTAYSGDDSEYILDSACVTSFQID